MTFTPLNILQFLIAFQGLVFGLHLLLGRRGKRVANRLLAVLLLSLAAQMAANVAADLGWITRRLHWPQLLALLYGPLLYFHVRALAHRQPRWGLEHGLHGVPFVTAVALRLSDELSVATLAFAIFASIGTYLALSFQVLRHYRRVLEATHSALGSITLGWLSTTLWILTAVWCLDMLSYGSNLAAPAAVENGVTLLLFGSLLFLVTHMVRRGLQSPEIFAGISEEDEAIVRQGETADSRVDPTAEVDEMLRLSALMDDERPHLDPGLTLDGLAARFGRSPRQLSRLIRRQSGSHFSDFINGYRVAAAGTALRAPGDGRSILDIAFAAGFNSKSTFNSAFKRHTGMTPTEFRSQVATSPGEQGAAASANLGHRVSEIRRDEDRTSGSRTSDDVATLDP